MAVDPRILKQAIAELAQRRGPGARLALAQLIHRYLGAASPPGAN